MIRNDERIVVFGSCNPPYTRTFRSQYEFPVTNFTPEECYA